jgi:hypothetical protein
MSALIQSAGIKLLLQIRISTATAGALTAESSSNVIINFYVSLTVILSITLANDQIDAQIFNAFITILYIYMFRAISCSSSGGQIVLIQQLVSSL